MKGPETVVKFRCFTTTSFDIYITQILNFIAFQSIKLRIVTRHGLKAILFNTVQWSCWSWLVGPWTFVRQDDYISFSFSHLLLPRWNVLSLWKEVNGIDCANSEKRNILPSFNINKVPLSLCLVHGDTWLRKFSAMYRLISSKCALKNSLQSMVLLNTSSKSSSSQIVLFSVNSASRIRVNKSRFKGCNNWSHNRYKTKTV